jgi:hypothetical protein
MRPTSLPLHCGILTILWYSRDKRYGTRSSNGQHADRLDTGCDCQVATSAVTVQRDLRGRRLDAGRTVVCPSALDPRRAKCRWARALGKPRKIRLMVRMRRTKRAIRCIGRGSRSIRRQRAAGAWDRDIARNYTVTPTPAVPEVADETTGGISISDGRDTADCQTPGGPRRRAEIRIGLEWPENVEGLAAERTRERT